MRAEREGHPIVHLHGDPLAQLGIVLLPVKSLVFQIHSVETKQEYKERVKMYCSRFSVSLSNMRSSESCFRRAQLVSKAGTVYNSDPEV